MTSFRVRTLVPAVAAALFLTSRAVSAQEPVRISAAATAQIETLLLDKSTWTVASAK